MSNTTFETGIYRDRNAAEAAVARLRELGYTEQEISVMMHDDAMAREFAAATGSKAAEGTGAGALIGGSLGAIIAGAATVAGVTAVVSTGGLAAPFVVGPLAAVLAGLGGGVVAGGIVGGLVGAGIPKEQADEYVKELESGGILLGVQTTPERRERVREAFNSRGEVLQGDVIRGDVPRDYVGAVPVDVTTTDDVAYNR
jgi:hypothetical protein